MHRNGPRLTALLAVLFAAFGVGCTHTQLRYNTVRQSLTVSDIHQKQVLDNLAKFVHDSHAIPDFAYVSQGASEVQDIGSLSLSFLWLWAGTGENSLGAGAERGATESWVLVPVTDPRRLELMRCAFQRAVSSCCQNGESTHCPNCTKRFNEFYTGRTHSTDDQGRPVLDETGAVASAVPKPWEETAPGIVNSKCLHAPCWFCVGRKQDLPANLDCVPWGSYCGVYVWVLPGHGTDELAKLTLAILDYAINEPARAPAKEVVIEYDVDGVRRIPRKITETFTTTTNDYLKTLQHDGEQARGVEGDRGTIFVPTAPTPVPASPPQGFDILRFQQRLETLSPFSR